MQAGILCTDIGAVRLESKGSRQVVAIKYPLTSEIVADKVLPSYAQLKLLSRHVKVHSFVADKPTILDVILIKSTRTMSGDRLVEKANVGEGTR